MELVFAYLADDLMMAFSGCGAPKPVRTCGSRQLHRSNAAPRPVCFRRGWGGNISPENRKDGCANARRPVMMSQPRRASALLRDNGLLLACLGLFAIFFAGMIISGTATYNQEQQEHGSREQLSVLKYLSTGDFVEATFQNWESEFLQMGMYVVLTAFLYQRGSSESKPVDEPHRQTSA